MLFKKSKMDGDEVLVSAYKFMVGKKVINDASHEAFLAADRGSLVTSLCGVT